MITNNELFTVIVLGVIFLASLMDDHHLGGRGSPVTKILLSFFLTACIWCLLSTWHWSGLK